jgi:NhaP-type Na+/H+ or K+/H+ antiporter
LPPSRTAPHCSYAVLGTFISALVFGLGTYLLVLLHIVPRSHLGGAPLVECLMYGAAISSIDPVATLAVLAQADVPPLLYNLVFGESVLNDAVAIVLFRSLAHYTAAPVGLLTLPAVMLRFCVLAAGSLAVGVGVALACAFLLKRFDAYYSTPGAGWAAGGRGAGGAAAAAAAAPGAPAGAPLPAPFDPTLYEIAIVLMGSYLAYLVAEVVGLSGIVALFFTGACAE